MSYVILKPESPFFILEDKPYGKTWEEWSALWWQWAVSMPKDKNPGMGTAAQIAASPAHDDVVFLVGVFDTVGKKVTHDLQIPAGKSIFFPVINCTNSFADTGCFAGAPQMKTENDLKNWAVKEISEIAKSDITINGFTAEQQKITSEVFDLNYIKDNVFDIKEGLTKAISVGYWVFLKSLPAGEYDITTYGACMLGKIKIDAAYHIVAR